MRKEKTPIYKLSRSKVPKTQQICQVTNTRENPADHFYCRTWASTLVLAIILLKFRCKSFCSCRTYNSLMHTKELKKYRNENSANLFSYADNDKDFWKVVYHHIKWDSCLVCVFYPSRSTRWIERSVATRKYELNDKKPEVNMEIQSQFRLCTHWQVCYTCICYNEHIDLCKPIQKYIYGSENHPFTGYPAAKHTKHS